MADELSTFFAKKAKKSKKPVAVNVGKIGEQLDRALQLQDQSPDDHNDTTAYTGSGVGPVAVNASDSDWLDPEDQPDLADLGIKDMVRSDYAADEEDEDDQEQAQEATKTWNMDQNTEKEEQPKNNAELVAAVFAPQAKYRPPVTRGHRRGQPVKLDLKSEEMFPTLAQADNIEKEEKTRDDALKTKQDGGGWQVQGATKAAQVVPPASNRYQPPSARQGPPGQRAPYSGSSSLNRQQQQSGPPTATAQPGPGAYRPHRYQPPPSQAAPPAPTPPPPVPVVSAAADQPARYVPPSRRAKN